MSRVEELEYQEGCQILVLIDNNPNKCGIIAGQECCVHSVVHVCEYYSQDLVLSTNTEYIIARYIMPK